MRRIAPWVVATLLACVVAFQLALVLGAPWGAWTQGGRIVGPLDAPGRAVAAVSALLLGVLALAALGCAGRGPLAARPRLARGLTWAGAVYSGVGIVLNAASPSAPERLVWVPVTACIAVLLVMTARAVPPGRRAGARR